MLAHSRALIAYGDGRSKVQGVHVTFFIIVAFISSFIRLGLHSSMRLSKSTTPHRPDSDEPPSLQRKSQPTLSSSTIESSPPTSPHESQHFSARVNNLRRVAIPVLAKVDTSPPPVTPNRVFVTSPTAGDHYDSEDDFSGVWKHWSHYPDCICHSRCSRLHLS